MLFIQRCGEIVVALFEIELTIVLLFNWDCVRKILGLISLSRGRRLDSQGGRERERRMKSRAGIFVR